MGRRIVISLAAVSGVLLGGLFAVSTPAAAEPAAAEPAAATPAAAPSPGHADAVRLCDAPAKAGVMQCMALKRTDVTPRSRVRPDAAPLGYGPADIQSAYDLPAGAGDGATVAIVDAFDDPTAEADLAVYRAQFGLPACSTANGCLRKIDQRGGTEYPEPDPSWAGEISLDLDAVSAACPRCHILLVEADSNDGSDLAAAVDQAVAQGAKYVSNSYGGPEDPTEADSDTHYDHPGVAITASSGDYGYGVSYPAASPYVTSVGGTSLNRDSSERGWAETVWHNYTGAPGSGCSESEIKPSYQHDDGCANRTVADVAAVADPITGLAVYQTYGGGGWGEFGGTSLAAPIIASVYALAGTPRGGDYPAYYPYAASESLHDVTDGTDTNDTCAPLYLCTAGSGYDGPTGLGTPDGVTAFGSTTGHGELVGTLTDAQTGKPVPNASVSSSAGTTRTDDAGRFVITAPVGSYQLQITAFGYRGRTLTKAVEDGRSTAFGTTLQPRSLVTLTGTVRDGSGEGYPLYATVSAPGTPLAAVHTNPYTGVFRMRVPKQSSFTLHTEAHAPGYQGTDTKITVGTKGLTRNVALPVDAASCTADGYQVHYAGMPAEPFDGASAPDGWTIKNDTENGGWEFDGGTVIPRTNETGGTGNFALVDTQLQPAKDTTLTTPVIDLSGVDEPSLGLDTQYVGAVPVQSASIDVSTDGGASWDSVWSRNDPNVLTGRLVIPLPQAANQPKVQVRFHYISQYGRYWELDNVWVGTRTCDPETGGLISGRVVNLATGAGVDDATVALAADPDEPATTQATPDDPAVGDGYFSLFAPGSGVTALTVQARSYTSVRDTVRVRAGHTVRARLPLAAGLIKLSPGTVSKNVRMGKTRSVTVTVTNRGSAPATIRLSEQPGGFTRYGTTGTATSAPVATTAPQRVHVPVSASSRAAPGPRTDVRAAAGPGTADPSWIPVAGYPSGPIMDNAAARSGTGEIYVVGGTADGYGPVATAYVYDPARLLWTRLPDLPTPVQQPVAAFLGGKLIVAGGWGPRGAVDTVQIYDPGTGAWSTGAPMPAARAAAGSAVQDSKLFVVDGCTSGDCPFAAQTVYVYDAAQDSWSVAPDYPAGEAFLSCGGGLSGLLVCAGGFDPADSSSSKAVYAYSASRGVWLHKADLPTQLWGSATAAANGELLMSGGVAGDTQTNAAVTNEGYSYDPASDSWSPLPNAPHPLYRGAATCGMFQLGGSSGSFQAEPYDAELPGYNVCGSSGDVPWLRASATTMRLAPGASRTLVLTLSAATARQADQPGTYTADLALQTDTPQGVLALPVTMTVRPPASWGEVEGTVSGKSCEGGEAPLAGATVSFQGVPGSATVYTDSSGRFARWVDASRGTVRLVVAADHYTPKVLSVAIAAGQLIHRAVLLQPVAC